MPRRKQTKPSHVQSDEEGEHETGTRSKSKASSSPSKGGKGGGGTDGHKEEAVVESRGRKGRTRQTAAEEEKKKKEEEEERRKPQQQQPEEEEEDEDVEVEEDNDEDSDEKGLLIAENTNEEKDSDDCDSDISEDLEQPVHNGTMTRRQASQLKESGDLTGAKKKNRTCEYCGVVKATPAALVRHLRKHTGERPFVCTLCGKAYKAKRSLNLHENTVHKGLAKNPLPTQIPLDSSPGTSFAVADSVKQQVGGVPPPISEATKSLLRETLESSRKARDGSTITTNVSTVGENDDITTTTTTDDKNDEGDADSSTVPTSERLAAPNLVNLLTSDLSRKVEQNLTASSSTSVSISSTSSLSSSTATTSLSTTISSPVLSIPKIKTDPGHHIEQTDAEGGEKDVKEEEDIEEVEVDVDDEEEEEQAQDLSIHPKRENKDKNSNSADDVTHIPRVAVEDIKCEFCPETFHHELQKANHIRQAHGIILNLSHSTNNKQTTSVIPPQPQAVSDVTKVDQAFMPTMLSAAMPGPSAESSLAASKRSMTQHHHHNIQYPPPHHPHHHPHHHHHHHHHNKHKSHRPTSATSSRASSNSHLDPNTPSTTNTNEQPPPLPSPSTFTKMDAKKTSTIPSSVHGLGLPMARGGGSLNAIPLNANAFLDPQTWVSMTPTPSATLPNPDTIYNNNTGIATAESFSALLARQMRDQQMVQQMSTLIKQQPTSAISSPSSSFTSSSSLHHAGGGSGDGGAVRIENGPGVPVPSVTGMTDGAATPSPASGLPLEENNTLPYYVTSRLLQDYSPDDVTLPESDKWVTAEDGGHRRCRTTVMKETVLATRLDGINNITGRLATVYKCHLCRRVFSSLVRYNNHMPSHADTEITTYDCRYCEASFRSHIQIIKHLQCHREKFAGFNSISLDDPSITGTSTTTTTTTAGTAVSVGHKKKGDHIQLGESGSSPIPVSLNNNNNSALNLMRVPSYNADENGADLSSSTSSLGGLQHPPKYHEPGERKNGGYSCPKCRKNFTREYLLQRHMRIHRNENSFYCPECDSGFTGELELMEHKKNHHGLKSAEEVQKYKTLLTQQQLAQQYGKQFGNASTGHDGNNNKSKNNGKGLEMSSHSAASGSVDNKSVSGQDNGVVGGGAGLFPMDLKGIDLRRGEEVQVRMLGGLSEDRQKEEWLKQFWSEKYKQAYLSKMIEMQTAILSAGSKGSGLQDGGAALMRDMEAMKQNMMRAAQERMKWMIMEGEISAVNSNKVNGGGEEGKSRGMEDGEKEERMKQKATNKLLRQQQEELMSKKQQLQLMERRKKEEEDNERQRRMEEEKLAQQGMGDVIVVLPDAPSPDESASSGGPTSSSFKLDNRGMAVIGTSDRSSTGVASSKKFKGEGVIPPSPSTPDAKMTGQVGRSENELKMDQGSCEMMRGNDIKTESYDDRKVGRGDFDESMSSTAGSKRPPSESGGSGPPAKSRRKALKPQKINHFEDEEDVVATPSSSVVSDSGKGSNSSQNPMDASTKAGAVGRVSQTVASSNDKNANSIDDNTVLLSKWKQLVALGGAQVFSAAAAAASPASNLPSSSSLNQQQHIMAGTPLSALTARNMINSNHTHKLLPGFDPTSGAPVLFNNNNNNNNSVNETGDDSCDGMAIDLSTSSSDKDRSSSSGNSKSKSSSTTAQEEEEESPQFSSTPKPASKMSGLSALSAAAAAISASSSSSLLSPSLSSPVKSCENDSKSFPDIGQRKSSVDSSFEHELNNQNCKTVTSDYLTHSVLTPDGAFNSKKGIDVTAAANSINKNSSGMPQIPSINPVQFTNALLSGATGMNPETAALVGLPQVLWSAAAANHNLTAVAAVAAGKSPTSSSSKMMSGPVSLASSIPNAGKVNGGSSGVMDSLVVGGGLGNLNINTNSNSSSSNKSRTSSPSSVSSPIGAGETALTSNDGRKVTSLSRTHSRLSVVNEPLDRNALCKPKVMEDGRSVYSCAICHKNFLSLSDINRHMDFHEDIRPYKCKYCDYYARTNSQLKVHKLRHEGVREFCCRVCNYKGVTQSDLNRHTKSQVHLLRSNHVCQRCGEGFVTPKALRDHTAASCNANRADDDSSFEGRSFDDDKIGLDGDDVIDDDDDDEEEEEEGREMGDGEVEDEIKMKRNYLIGRGEEMDDGGRETMSSVIDMRMVA